MKRLNITKENYEKSTYFQNKYGTLKYVSESGKFYKTNKGQVLRFKENSELRSKNWNTLTIELEKNPRFPGECEYKVCTDTTTVARFLSDSEIKDFVNELLKCNKPSESTAMFNEAVHPHETDAYVPVTKMEEWLCGSIPDEIEEFCADNGLEVTCGANWHNPGEEQHIEIYVGLPEGDEFNDPKYDNIEEKLEKFVNEICERKYKFQSSLINLKGGEKWGDASFQWISDNELFGEVWPIDGQDQMVNEAIPKTLKEIPKEQAEMLIQKHLRAGTGEWESSPGYSDFIYEIGKGRYKLIRPGFGGRYETGLVSM